MVSDKPTTNYRISHFASHYSVEIVSRLIKGDEKCIFATPTKQRRTARFCGLFHPWYILLF